MSSLRETAVPRSGARRMLGAALFQGARTPRCPDTPRLDGALAVVTGATGGIGLEIARGLVRRGAELILPCRNPAKGDALLARLRAEPGASGAQACVPLDLEDLDGVRACANEIARRTRGREIDVLVENAGVWPQRYARTRQGHEIAFGVNVLAHFVLRRALAAAGVLCEARVVMLTGDIYILASECTPHFHWRGPLGGMQAYCRSKLGNLWIGSELARREPGRAVCVVHPGVVATGLGGDFGVIGAWVRRQLMIPPELGAQMPLVCATQPRLESGGYWHNAHGRMRLAPGDSACDAAAAARLFETCEELARAHGA